MTATQDRELRQALRGTLESLQPPPAPLDSIIRQSRRIRLRRAGAAAGALGLAGIIAITSLSLRAQQPGVPAAAPAVTAGPSGVFASGTAEGHPWRLAVRNIADPGYRCLPAITINGTDADPVYPGPGNAAAVALGQPVRDTAFAFVQLPAGIDGVVVNGKKNVPAVVVNLCGYHYRLAGFSYPLTKSLRVSLAKPYPGWPADIFVPTTTILPPAQATSSENDGLWFNTNTATGPAASAQLAAGTLPGGQGWMIKLQFGPGGDCYEFAGINSAQMGYCGPVSTPAGPETIMALPLAFGEPAVGATGYAFQVSPGTAHVRAVFDNGTSTLATPRVVEGRKYVAFIAYPSRSVDRLIWLDASGTVIASTTAVPPFGYAQFQP